jgi:hypothetical protein
MRNSDQACEILIFRLSSCETLIDSYQECENTIGAVDILLFRPAGVNVLIKGGDFDIRAQTLALKLEVVRNNGQVF